MDDPVYCNRNKREEISKFQLNNIKKFCKINALIHALTR